MRKKPKIGDRVRVHQTNAYGEDVIFTATVHSLLSMQFVAYAGDSIHFVFYTDEWRVSNEDLL
jgi:hypothetical protein